MVWCNTVGVVAFLWWPVVWWCFCFGVVVFLWWCFCFGVLVFLCLCFCGGGGGGGGGGGVFVVFLWRCFCVFVLVFLYVFFWSRVDFRRITEKLCKEC